MIGGGYGEDGGYVGCAHDGLELKGGGGQHAPPANVAGASCCAGVPPIDSAKEKCALVMYFSNLCIYIDEDISVRGSQNIIDFLSWKLLYCNIL